MAEFRVHTYEIILNGNVSKSYLRGSKQHKGLAKADDNYPFAIERGIYRYESFHSLS